MADEDRYERTPALQMRLATVPEQTVPIFSQRLGPAKPRTPEHVRALRAIEVLRQIGTPPARAVLEKLAKSGELGLVAAAQRALDQPAIPPKHIGPDLQLSPQDLQARWHELLDRDGSRGYQALRILAATPGQTLPFLKTHLKLVVSPDAQRITRLIADLDSERYVTRQQAMMELEKLAELAKPWIEQTLADEPPLEVRRRLEQLSRKMYPEPLPPERLRLIRSLEVLERANAQAARQLLLELSRGAPEAWLTQQAKAIVQRVDFPREKR